MHGSLEYCLNGMKYFKKKSRIIWMAVKLRIAIFVKQNVIFKTTQSRNITLILLVGKLKIRSVTGQVITNITLDRVLKSRNPFYQSSFHATVQPFFSSVQSLSRVWLFATPWIAACQASLSITSSRSSLRLTSIESVMLSSHLILCRPLLLLPPIPPSIRVFSNKSALRMRWPKYWSFSFSIIPSKEIPGLISFRVDWLDLLAV